MELKKLISIEYPIWSRPITHIIYLYEIGIMIPLLQMRNGG